MNSPLTITTERTRLEICGPDDAALMLRYFSENQTRLKPWEPVRPEGISTLPYWQEMQQQSQALFDQKAGYKFTALTPDRSEVIGLCNFYNIVLGAFQACNLGYSVAGKYQGQGYMYEIVRAGMDYIFNEVGLHRIMANYIPTNERSGKLLVRLGFEVEGTARDYLKINGRWQDHILTACINPRPV